MLKKSLPFMLMVALLLGVGAGVTVFTQQAQVPQIPGITATDERPNGCVNCHKDSFKLSTIIGGWASAGASQEIVSLVKAAWPEATVSGKHPDVAAMVASQELPTFCLNCHSADSKMPLSRDLHLVHFTGGAENGFLTNFGGFCTNCHLINLDTTKPPAGTMTTKTGKE
ncbi:MAG: hypothetical protein A2Z21_02915 [Candidatus Fraserbacteria bacterium RBG_16_55_9]|uniref:Uncharacterized protein n=1 Tax=Fraserbacteria sp. (strain RBG_16_55_9) TaxID=1817864 RepID=A0A1F5UYK7_FRAXR|nr:MAG: hypothetical protein A2Z21_02915 [Candidatus Fraserbacteria bacterium RBG_16_55_9]